MSGNTMADLQLQIYSRDDLQRQNRVGRRLYTIIDGFSTGLI